MLVVTNKDSLMHGNLCCKVHGGLSQLLFALHQSSIDSQLFVKTRDLCLPHLHSMSSFGGFPSEYCHNVWYGKEEKLEWCGNPVDSGGENILKICLLISTESMNVTDRQTDGHHMTA